MKHRRVPPPPLPLGNLGARLGKVIRHPSNDCLKVEAGQVAPGLEEAQDSLAGYNNRCGEASLRRSPPSSSPKERS